MLRRGKLFTPWVSKHGTHNVYPKQATNHNSRRGIIKACKKIQVEDLPSEDGERQKCAP